MFARVCCRTLARAAASVGERLEAGLMGRQLVARACLFETHLGRSRQMLEKREAAKIKQLGDRRARDTCASHKTMIDRPAYRQTDRLDSTHRLGLPATIGATLSPVSVTEGTAPASTAPSSFSARQTPPHVRSIRVWPRAFRRRHCRRW